MRRAAPVIMIVLLAAARGRCGELFDDAALRFAGKVDVEALSLLPVQHCGRVAILDTLARQQVAQAYGRADIDAVEPAFAFLELYFNAGAYLDRPVLYVREKNMREFLGGAMDHEDAAHFLLTRRLPPVALADERFLKMLVATGRATGDDLLRAGNAYPSLRDALRRLAGRPEFRVPLERLSGRYESFVSEDGLRAAPSTGRWLSFEELASRSPGTAARPAEYGRVLGELASAWRARDAAAVNAAAKSLGGMTRLELADAMPSETVLRLERLYNRWYEGRVTFAGFAAATLLLILAASGARWARAPGLGAMALSTAALLAAFAVRWVLSGREWYLPPIMNLFEAVTGSALLAAVAAIIMELIRPKNYFGLAASFYAAIAMLGGLLFPEAMEPGISAQHGILHSPAMAVHVAAIIMGHAFVGMTFVLSAAYLVVFGLRAARAGGAEPLSSGGNDLSAPAPPGALAAIDRCNLIAAQLACWTVAAGTMLGAWWADFAWGRWWGWDIKETWALITALIYVLIIHVRFSVPPRARGLWTAVLCVLGCAVMLFNWFIVNRYFAGLHSYG